MAAVPVESVGLLVRGDIVANRLAAAFVSSAAHGGEGEQERATSERIPRQFRKLHCHLQGERFSPRWLQGACPCVRGFVNGRPDVPLAGTDGGATDPAGCAAGRSGDQRDFRYSTRSAFCAAVRVKFNVVA